MGQRVGRCRPIQVLGRGLFQAQLSGCAMAIRAQANRAPPAVRGSGVPKQGAPLHRHAGHQDRPLGHRWEHRLHEPAGAGTGRQSKGARADPRPAVPAGDRKPAARTREICGAGYTRRQGTRYVPRCRVRRSKREPGHACCLTRMPHGWQPESCSTFPSHVLARPHRVWESIEASMRWPSVSQPARARHAATREFVAGNESRLAVRLSFALKRHTLSTSR